jgi:hypothetical protein
MVEYQVLIPGSILLVIVVAWIIGPELRNTFLKVLRPMMEQKACASAYDFDDNSICSTNGDCEKAEWEDMDSGTFEYESTWFVESVVIKAGKGYNVYRADPGNYETTTDDGCYQVTFYGNTVEWVKIGDGPSCKAISHIDVWQAPICQ